MPEFQSFAASHPAVKLVPRVERDAYFPLIQGARFLVWPSLGYYETFGRVAIEAYACGVPVLGSYLGANGEMVQDGQTGLHFNPEDPRDLAAKVQWAWDHPAEMSEMGRKARKKYEAEFAAEKNYERIMEIYHTVLARRGLGSGAKA